MAVGKMWRFGEKLRRDPGRVRLPAVEMGDDSLDEDREQGSFLKATCMTEGILSFGAVLSTHHSSRFARLASAPFHCAVASEHFLRDDQPPRLLLPVGMGGEEPGAPHGKGVP